MPDASDASFEKALKALEASVNQLESGDLALEDALVAFEQGVRWSRQCHQYLEAAEARIELILKDEHQALELSEPNHNLFSSSQS